MSALDATERELTAARRAGVAACRADAPRAPGLDLTVLELIGKDRPVGEPRTLQLMAAFDQGYAAEVDRIIDELPKEPPLRTEWHYITIVAKGLETTRRCYCLATAGNDHHEHEHEWIGDDGKRVTV